MRQLICLGIATRNLLLFLGVIMHTNVDRHTFLDFESKIVYLLIKMELLKESKVRKVVGTRDRVIKMVTSLSFVLL